MPPPRSPLLPRWAQRSIASESSGIPTAAQPRDARVNYTLSEAGTSQKQSLRWGPEHVVYWENPWEKGTGNRMAKMWSQLKSDTSLQRGWGGGVLQCDWHPRAHPTQGHQWVIGQGWQWDEAGGTPPAPMRGTNTCWPRASEEPRRCEPLAAAGGRVHQEEEPARAPAGAQALPHTHTLTPATAGQRVCS